MENICFKAEIERGLATKARFNAPDFAKLCKLSVRQLQRKFRRQLGCSPQAWLDEQRIIAAGPLLLSGQPVKLVAYNLGFKQPSHFCRKFKEQTKMTPSEFISTEGGTKNSPSCRSQIIRGS